MVMVWVVKIYCSQHGDGGGDADGVDNGVSDGVDVGAAHRGR